jgi:hypothetical protein
MDTDLPPGWEQQPSMSSWPYLRDDRGVLTLVRNGDFGNGPGWYFRQLRNFTYYGPFDTPRAAMLGYEVSKNSLRI